MDNIPKFFFEIIPNKCKYIHLSELSLSKRNEVQITFQTVYFNELLAQS